jgi:hypothetical protein
MPQIMSKSVVRWIIRHPKVQLFTIMTGWPKLTHRYKDDGRFLVSKFFLCLQLSWPPSDNDHVSIDTRVQKHMHETVSQ